MHFIFYIIYTSCANLVSGHKQQTIKVFDNHCCERIDNGEYSSPGFETTFKNQSAGKKDRNKSNLQIYKENLM